MKKVSNAFCRPPRHVPVCPECGRAIVGLSPAPTTLSPEDLKSILYWSAIRVTYEEALNRALADAAQRGQHGFKPESITFSNGTSQIMLLRDGSRWTSRWSPLKDQGRQHARVSSEMREMKKKLRPLVAFLRKEAKLYRNPDFFRGEIWKAAELKFPELHRGAEWSRLVEHIKLGEIGEPGTPKLGRIAPFVLSERFPGHALSTLVRLGNSKTFKTRKAQKTTIRPKA